MNGEQLLVPFRNNFKCSVHAPDRLSSQFPNCRPDFVTRQCAGISSCWSVAGSGEKRLARLLYLADFTLLNVGS
ncbi:hypothetical protein T06_6150 [Trichinella sp. T6]|nr:hypothetical protein T06_6150 [Trichinella sp. T6]